MKEIKIKIYRTKDDQLRIEFKTENSTIEKGTDELTESDGYWGEKKWLKKELLGLIAELDTDYIVDNVK